MRRTRIIVMAKEPLPGKVKTRLTPPFTPEQAAGLAEAALGDTLDAAIGTPGARPVLALEGAAGAWLPPGVEVISQRGDGLDERLAYALADSPGTGAAMLIGMDTPQVSPAMLSHAVAALRRDDAVFGPATDGGFWLLGLRHPDPAMVKGVPMSRPDTGARQRGRLVRAGLRVTDLPTLTDVDTDEDVRQVAALAPHTRFAAAVREASTGMVA